MIRAARGAFYCGAGTGRPNWSKPSPACPADGLIAQLFGPITKQFIFLGISGCPFGNRELDPPPTWKSLQSISANRSPLSSAVIIDSPDDDRTKKFRFFALTGDVDTFVPASWKENRRFRAKSSASKFSVSSFTNETLSRCIIFSFSVNNCQLTNADLGKTARSSLSSRQRSLAVRRCSCKRLASICFAAFLAFSSSAAAASNLACASDLNLSSSSLPASASRLCEIICPAVATTTNPATNATTISAAKSAPSHHSPLYPQNRLEFIAFAAVIAGVSLSVFGIIFGMYVIRAYKRRPKI